MSDIGSKSIGFLIDELITTDLKCFMAQEKIQDGSLDNEIRLSAAIDAQKLNARRNQLIRKIDELLGFSNITLTEKTY